MITQLLILQTYLYLYNLILYDDSKTRLTDTVLQFQGETALKVTLHLTRFQMIDNIDRDDDGVENNLADPYFKLKINSNFSYVRKETLRIVEIDFDTILVRENCQAKTVNWEFENLYWVDPADGFVWKSRQVIARGFPPVQFEILKPPT